MKKLKFGVLLFVTVSLFVATGHVFADGSHRVLLFGDSLTAMTLNVWPNFISYNHTVVAKGGESTKWVLEQIEILIASGEINDYDTAVVWIGVNDPYLAVTDIPEIYRILRSYGIKIIGVTQYLHYCPDFSDEDKNNIAEFNEIVRAQADIVLDFAVDPQFVISNGYINARAAADCVHLDQNTMTDYISSAVNRAIDELYAPTLTPATFTNTSTNTPEPTATPTLASPTMTSTSAPTLSATIIPIDRARGDGGVETTRLMAAVSIAMILVAMGIVGSRLYALSLRR